MMPGDISENALQRAEFDGPMIRNDLVMFAVLLSGDPQMRTLLAGNDITQYSEGFDKVGARQVARNFHGVRISSRTK